MPFWVKRCGLVNNIILNLMYLLWFLCTVRAHRVRIDADGVSQDLSGAEAIVRADREAVNSTDTGMDAWPLKPLLAWVQEHGAALERFAARPNPVRISGAAAAGTAVLVKEKPFSKAEADCCTLAVDFDGDATELFMTTAAGKTMTKKVEQVYLPADVDDSIAESVDTTISAVKRRVFQDGMVAELSLKPGKKSSIEN